MEFNTTQENIHKYEVSIKFFVKYKNMICSQTMQISKRQHFKESLSTVNTWIQL